MYLLLFYYFVHSKFSACFLMSYFLRRSHISNDSRSNAIFSIPSSSVLSRCNRIPWELVWSTLTALLRFFTTSVPLLSVLVMSFVFFVSLSVYNKTGCKYLKQVIRLCSAYLIFIRSAWQILTILFLPALRLFFSKQF